MDEVVRQTGSKMPFLVGGGEMGTLIRAHDWAASPLGLLETWPERLRVVVETLFAVPQAMWIGWGPQLIQIYNDEYRALLDEDRHGAALGRPASETWADNWSVAGPMLTGILAGGPAVLHADRREVYRHEGALRERYFSFSFSPIPDPGAPQGVGGVLCVAVETTPAVRLREGEARLRGVLDGMGESFALLDPEFRIIDMNAVALQMEGRPAQEVLGKTHWEAHPDADPVLGELFRRAMIERRLMHLEHRYVWPDGRVTWLAVRVYPVEDGLAVFYGDITDRKLAEERLRALNADLERQVIERTHERGRTWSISPDMLSVIDLATGVFDRVNPAWTVTLGWPADELEGSLFTDFVHPDDLAASYEGLEVLKRGDPLLSFENRYRTKAGAYRWVRWVAVPEGGKLYSTTRDVTDEKAQEAELAERTAERDHMWETSPDLMLVIDFDGVFRRVNPAWTAILGYTPEELVGHHVNEFVVSDDQQATVEAYQLAAEGGQPRILNRYRAKNGSLRWISWTAAPAGELTYATGRDVTAERARQDELAAAEAARREADALYRAYFENTAEALFVVNVLEDGGFTIEDLNPAHQASVGLPLAEVAGKRIEAILPPEAAERVQDFYRRAVGQGSVYQYREAFEHRGKTKVWDTVLVPVLNEDGGVVRLIGSSRDLTAQITAEDALRQSQKLDAMGQLTGGVAHDFNNLLTPIIASLDMLLRRGVGSDRERRLMDGALQSADRAKVLVQRLLAFARKQPLQPGPVNVRRLVSEMADLIASTSGPRIDVRVELPEDLPPALADANQLEMALLNLAVNARDAMPDAGVLTISAARASVRGEHAAKLRPGHYVRLSVRDTGTGMDQVTLTRAIEPFFSTKGIGKGTGLGLSMVHGLTEQLGGGLTITSSPGKGTTVDLWLPISAVALEEGGGVPSTTAVPKAQGTVLLADDEDLVRLTTADMLMDLGYEVREVSSADEALRLMDDGLVPDLVVTDHLMPGMTGLDLARDLRSRRPDLPVLIVSGYAEMDGIAPGFARLTKPFRASELASSLAALMPERIH